LDLHTIFLATAVCLAPAVCLLTFVAGNSAMANPKPVLCWLKLLFCEPTEGTTKQEGRVAEVVHPAFAPSFDMQNDFSVAYGTHYWQCATSSKGYVRIIAWNKPMARFSLPVSALNCFKAYPAVMLSS